MAGRTVRIAGLSLPAAALDQALDDIAARYGPSTADLVELQLEYPRP